MAGRSSGYRSPDRVVVLDPLSGRHVVPYDRLRSNWRVGVWTETITFDEKRESIERPVTDNRFPGQGSWRDL